MSSEELNEEDVLDLFYKNKGNLDDLNRLIDERLKAHRTRKITLFEKFVRSRIQLNARVLKMADMEVSPQEVVFLSKHPEVKDVEVLDLRKNGFGDIGLEAIVRSPMLTQLKVLDLRSNGITRLGMETLAQCESLRLLEKLDLRMNKLGKRWEEKLLATGNFPNLNDLKTA